MTKHHYVYKSFEEEGREYIGIRSCDCLPEEDIKYFGSFRDKSFKPTKKTILFVCETREEVLEIEVELHDFFDVAVNPQFANQAKQTGTKFDRTGFTGEKHPLFGVPHTEEWKKAMSEKMSGGNHPMYGRTGERSPCYGRTGEKHPLFGVPNSEAQKKAHSERMFGEKHPMYGRTGALNPNSKAIVAIKPDGTEKHYVSGREAVKDLKIAVGSLAYYLKIGHVLRCGKFKDWQFIYQNP